MPYYPLIIANGAAVSESFDLPHGHSIVGIETPVAWTAADIVFQVARDGSTFVDIMDVTGALVRVTTIATAAVEVRVTGDDINSIDTALGGQKFRLRSVNTASSADVNQGAARTVRVLTGRRN